MMTKPRVHPFESFGIVPAAGHSRRMGQPKLKMPWGGLTVIEQVVAAWRRGGVDHVMAVVRADDAELARMCDQAGAIVVSPTTPPPEMKDSVLAALDAIVTRYQPQNDAVWLLAPADMPRLSSAVIEMLLDAHCPLKPAILVPTHATHPCPPAGQTPSVKRGHPVLFPWPLAQDVAKLNEDEGVNALLKHTRVREVAVNEPAILEDLDTVDDYRRLSADEGCG
jgi:molybdenum cofactor cytidylyltransferase